MNIFKSKTVLFGLLLTIASIIQVVVPFLPIHLVGPVGTITGIIVIILRFVTTIPLGEK
jgi:hypothetical protein